jgi:hypothetical protein
MPKAPLTNKMLCLMLRPLVRLFIRHNHGFAEVMEALRAEFINVAIDDLNQNGYEVNTSRVSAVTGIGRREVLKVMKSPVLVTNQATISSRVIGAWEQGKDYKDDKGEIKKLSICGTGSEFFNLVESVSKDINPYTLLFELERTGSIKRISENSIELVKNEFVPSKAPEDSIELVSSDLDDFVTAVDENIYGGELAPNLHLKTEYTNVRLSSIPEIKKWIMKEGSDFHKRIRDFVAKFDLDLYPDTDQQTGVEREAGGVRVALGTFSRIVKPIKE